ncbi:hypothetical protein [Adhaeribacter aquaticus]|uniref:hypothetical protein n=1 Tax=Adhaeribacter aquaticus TaxID=299567 RepID=UPI00041390B8|nr:hypothetical protein [Adhaeribacter aquaticus]
MGSNSEILDSATLVVENAFVKIFIIQAESILILEWKFQITLAERKSGFLQALEIIKAYELRSWVVSNKNIYYVSPEEKSWIINEWLDLLNQSTLERSAIVCHENYDVLMSTWDLTSEVQQQFQKKGIIQHRVFMNFPNALNWLLSDMSN